MTILRYWKFIGLGLICLLLAVQTVRLNRAHDQIEKRDVRINELVGELKRISDAKNEQEIITVEMIKEVEKIRRVGEKEAKRIETAPTEPGCTTPDIIMQSDDL